LAIENLLENTSVKRMSFFVSYEGRNDEAKEGRDYLQGVAESASISRPGEG